MRYLGRLDHGLRGNACDVDAGSTDVGVFHQGHPSTSFGPLHRQRLAPFSATEHDQVISLSGVDLASRHGVPSHRIQEVEGNGAKGIAQAPSLCFRTGPVAPWALDAPR